MRAVELAFQELGGATNASQRVLDLVGEAADQLAIRLLLLEQAFLAGDLELLVDVAELDDELRTGKIERRDGAGEMQRLSGRDDLDLLLGVGCRAPDRLGDGGDERAGIAEQVRRRAIDELLPRDFEKILCSGIRVGDALAGAEDQHGGGEQIQAAKLGRVLLGHAIRKIAEVHVARPGQGLVVRGGMHPVRLAISAPT